MKICDKKKQISDRCISTWKELVNEKIVILSASVRNMGNSDILCRACYSCFKAGNFGK